MPKYSTIFAFLFLISCNSPEARLGRLQHEFWEKFARQDFYEVRMKNQVLHWPLPPAAESSEQQKAMAERLQKEAKSIEKEKLSEVDQRQLTQLCAALDDCVENAGSPLFDPSRCVITAQLQQFSTDPELSLLLEKIPDYYTQIEQRWQIPDARFVSKAVEESQNGLDLLAGLEQKTGLSRIAGARAALKDFIGLCQSAVLIR